MELEKTKVFVTGASGFIGGALVELLLKETDWKIVAGFHSNPPAWNFINDRIETLKLDITQAEEVRMIFKTHGFKYIFHLAGYARIEPNKSRLSEAINTKGTVHILEAANASGVEKVILVSTAGVFGPTDITKVKNEASNYHLNPHTSYEQSKQDILPILKNRAWRFKWIVLYPSRVYGPGPLSPSNSTTKWLLHSAKSKIIFLPAKGAHFGSYVFIKDVATALHMAAITHSAERHLLIAGQNTTMKELAEIVERLTGKRKIKVSLPAWLLIVIATAIDMLHKYLGTKRILAPEWVKRYMQHWKFDGTRAENTLGFKYHSLEEGVKKTLMSFKAQNSHT